MTDILFRMYLNDEPATRDQLNRVEEITVEQEVDMAWEARLKIPIWVDDEGRWSGEDEPLIAPGARIRVELKLGDEPWGPLIDGPIVDHDSEMKPEPGRSAITVIVHDDSAYLNRKDTVARFENLSDHKIAAQLFSEVEQIKSTDIEETASPAVTPAPPVIQRGSAMQILRALARRQLARRRSVHAYVLPGERPGESVGCFKAIPTEPDGLPPLVLLGPDRNLETFTPKNEARKPSTVRAASVSLSDKRILRATSRFRDLELLGAEAPFQNESDTTDRLLGPLDDFWSDPESAAAAEADRASYSFEATGSVRTECYPAVLQPYRVVTVLGANARLSGDYQIHRVTHTLTRSTYSQSFMLKRNARSAGSGAGLLDPAGSIF